MMDVRSIDNQILDVQRKIAQLSLELIDLQRKRTNMTSEFNDHNSYSGGSGKTLLQG